MIKIKIDGKTLEVKPKTSIIEVADKVGIDIPRFCSTRNSALLQTAECALSK